MNKQLKHIFILVVLIVVLVLPYFVFAQSAPLQTLEGIREESGYEEADQFTIAKFLGTGVNAFLSILGIIFIILMLTAGYNWMTASGDEEKLRRAQKTILRATIGLAITVGSYAIWNFIANNVLFAP
jgi:cytochrome bd-type quinol oxidase subunit 2